MKRIKVVARIIFYLFATILLFIAMLHFALIYIAPLESIREKVISVLHEQTLADIQIQSISASIFDFQVKGVDLKIKNNDLAHINTIYLHFSPSKLLKGQIKLNRITLEGLNIIIHKDKDGKSNLNYILEAPIFKEKENVEKVKEEKVVIKKQDEAKENPIDLLLYRTQLQDCNITYIDEQANINLCLASTSFNIKSFTFDNSFKFDFFTNLSATIGDMNIDELEIALSSIINLQKIDLSQAELNINSFVLRLKDTIIQTKGIISDFNNPKANIITQILNLDSNNLSTIIELPTFRIPIITIHTLTNLNLEESLVNIENFKINILDSTINATGKINYSKNLEYNLNVAINLILDKICQTIEMTKVYSPCGNIKANLNITNKSSLITGECSLINISAYTPQLGKFSEINSKINIKNINDIRMTNLKGKLNDYPFTSSASYIIGKTKGDIKATFTADRMFGKMSKEFEQTIGKKEETKTEKKVEPIKKEKSKFSLPPLDILVNVSIGDMDFPFFMGKDVIFKMDMKKVTPDLKAVEGELDLSTINGTIKDIYKLTQTNVILKGMFLSLKIVSDVINALNVLDILNNIGTALASSNKTEQTEPELTQEHQEAKAQKMDGKMDFVSFITDIDFKNGKGTFNKCSFVSNLLSFKVSGEMNFNENIIDMTVNTAPGKHEEDGGSMPLTMKINGTMDNPTGSLSLLGSVANLVGDALMKNMVSDSLKSGFMSLLGMKKHDEKGNDIMESTTTINTNSIVVSTQTQTN